MNFSITDDNVLYLYPYYSMNDKEDEMSKKVYQVFKKDWGTHFNDIYNDLCSAIESYGPQQSFRGANIAITVMPSHSKGKYGENLLKMANCLARKFRYTNESNLIQRTADKKKSTEGGERSVAAHLATLGLGHSINKEIGMYIILDDITTTGSSLEAARQLLTRNGVSANKIIKMAVAKTTHDNDY